VIVILGWLSWPARAAPPAAAVRPASGLAQSRRDTAAVSADPDDLAGRRDTAYAYTASTPGGDGPPGPTQ
jgi:hypothetical protein